jgi:alanyl-tRNA synthetase
LITDLKKDYQNKILGKDVFLFHDTFGFPSDLTRMIAAEHKMVLDEQGFEVAMQEQQERARKSQKFASELASDEHWVLLQPQKDSLFLGYDSLRCPVTALRFQEKQEYIYLVLDQTPFYAESGGQVGDIGLIQGKDVQLRVIDTFKVFDMHVHKTVLADGFFTGTPEQLTGMIAQVDPLHRGHIKRNHSATHLLQAALRKLLGAHIVQQGSHVGADRLRFDFTHHQGLDKPTQQAVEALVNQEILANTPVYSHVMGFEQAKTSGAMALFGETYGDTVRVLTMGQDAFSKELCGGTHVHASGDIGFFKITLETSISAGVRRIEAVTGTGALGYVQTQDLTLHAH